METRYWFRPFMLVGDLLLYFLAYEMAFYIRFLGDPPEVNHEAFIRVLPWLFLTIAFLHHFYRLYDLRTPWDERLAGVFSAALLNTVVAFALSFLLRGFAFPRSVLGIGPMLAVPLLFAWHRTLYVYSSRIETQRVIVVGPPGDVESFAGRMPENPSSHVVVVEVVPLDGGEVTDDFLMTTSTHTGADAVLLLGGIEHSRKMHLMERAYRLGLDVLVIPELPEILLASARRERIGDYLILRVGDTGSRWDPAKRLFDVALASLGLLIGLPIMAVTALAIRLDSPGPVLYRQTRVTTGGKQFTLYKFRTMRDGAEESTGPVLSYENDPRVTRVGRILRMARLDELPQLWNVLRGDMSLVGPRPERPYFVQQFTAQLPHYVLRHRVRPGITGLAQINARYSTSPQDKLRFDLLYIHMRSLYTDLAVLLETVRTVFTRGRSA